MKELPLAIRLDLYAQTCADGRAATDFQTPYGLKLLSGDTISRKISHFFYTFLVERGDLGGVEDAIVHSSDLGGARFDRIVGQFQISDPVFKRELRLEFEDYAIYRASLGSVPVDLTYDRGLMASADIAGITLSGQLLNGSGSGSAQASGRFDVDSDKNIMVHVRRGLGGALHLGAFGCHGHSHGNGVANRTRMLAGDGTLEFGPIQLNGQLVHRHDDQPTFTPGERGVTTNGRFAELLLKPSQSHQYGYGLYNRVDASRPMLDIREGGPTASRRYQSQVSGVGRLIERNVRVIGEASYDLETDNARFAIGVNAAF
jgi:hypothetical protein